MLLRPRMENLPLYGQEFPFQSVLLFPEYSFLYLHLPKEGTSLFSTCPETKFRYIRENYHYSEKLVSEEAPFLLSFTMKRRLNQGFRFLRIKSKLAWLFSHAVSKLSIFCSARYVTERLRLLSRSTVSEMLLLKAMN